MPLLRTLRVNAEGAGRSVTRLAGSATKAAAELRSGATRSRGTSSTLASLAGAAGGFVSVAGLLGQFTGPMSRAMTVLGIGLGAAAGAMTAVNVAMRANPLGFLAGLVVPVVTAITAYALNTETGQKIVKQVFDHVLKVFRGIATFLGPVVTSCGTVVGACFKAVGTVVTTVAGIVGAAVSGDFGRAGAAVSRATGALSDLVRRPWNAFKEAVRPVLEWITRRIPDMFTRVRDATSGTLGGIGDFVSTGLQALAGVVTGPVKGLIAFANWVIDGLNSLGGEFLGKKFGVDLDKIPQLAEGGVVAPSYDGASAVRPLSSLDRLRPAEAGHRVDAPRPPHRGRLHTYREPEGRSALAIAEDLLFLHRTAA
ncbi:tape-measure protein [Streptomyces sp. MRC013]|uniref:tape-measure protein n=1 Tax=Streptomyces sp. MRC013 TaxID=2898276 RepID=UPI002026DDEB|nr:tape-measure protein [Streptomyces sp. MRC013]URM90082.1 tape-measure protein [Streptomyces sp. MRC013]